MKWKIGLTAAAAHKFDFPISQSLLLMMFSVLEGPVFEAPATEQEALEVG